MGILATNTPAFLESIFGIAAAGGVHVGVNYRLKVEDVAYIFEFAEVSRSLFLYNSGLRTIFNSCWIMVTDLVLTRY